MKTYIVSVEKRMYAKGTFALEAHNADHAIRKVNDLITSGKLQTTGIEWDDPEYEDDTFMPTGDVS
jgi:hypothetical protein